MRKPSSFPYPLKRVPGSNFYYYVRETRDPDPRYRTVFTLCENKDYSEALCNDYLGPVPDKWDLHIEDFKMAIHVIHRTRRKVKGGFWNLLLNRLSLFLYGEYEYKLRVE